MSGLLQANEALKRQTRDIFGQLARTEQQRDITNEQLAAQEKAAKYSAAGTGAGLGAAYGGDVIRAYRHRNDLPFQPSAAEPIPTGGGGGAAAAGGGGTTLESGGLNATSTVGGDLALSSAAAPIAPVAVDTAGIGASSAGLSGSLGLSSAATGAGTVGGAAGAGTAAGTAAATGGVVAADAAAGATALAPTLGAIGPVGWGILGGAALGYGLSSLF